jgi:hypothetical protein
MRLLIHNRESLSQQGFIMVIRSLIESYKYKTMMTLFTILLNNLLILILSISLNIFILAVINLALFGLHLKTILNNLLEKRIYLISIFSFFFFIMMKYYSITMYLEEVIVSTTIDNVKFEISGEALTQIYQNIGSASVFAVGASITAGLVAKYPVGLIPKVGIIGGTGSLFTINYRLIMDSFNSGINQSHGNISISAPVRISLERIEHLDKNKNINELITNAFKPENYLFGDFSTRLQFKKETVYNSLTNKFNTILLDDNIINNSNILKALEQQNHNWKDSFIPSPLEPTDFIINTLSNNILLEYIILYLLFMLLIIISCKILIRDEIELKTIKRFVVSEVLSKFIKKYITIWQTSNILWIYFILISIIISEMVSILSLINILKIFTNT